MTCIILVFSMELNNLYDVWYSLGELLFVLLGNLYSVWRRWSKALHRVIAREAQAHGKFYTLFHLGESTMTRKAHLQIRWFGLSNTLNLYTLWGFAHSFRHRSLSLMRGTWVDPWMALWRMVGQVFNKLTLLAITWKGTLCLR